MQGIASLLDEASAREVRALWDELERTHGLREAARSVPYPHVSYHIAEEYDPARIGGVMRRVAERAAPFSVRIIGLGAFTAFEPVLYLAVERNPELDMLHAALWRELAADAGAARDPSPLYASASWVPHVTLAQRDLTSEALESLLTRWSSRVVRLEVQVHNLTLFYKPPDATVYTPIEQFTLSGESGGR